MRARLVAALAMLELASAGASVAHAWPTPKVGMVVGVDASTFWLQRNPSDLIGDGVKVDLHVAPVVGAALRWQPARMIECEAAIEVAEVGRRDRIPWLHATAYDPVGRLGWFGIEQITNVIDFPIRARLVAPGHSGWLLELGFEPAYLTAASASLSLFDPALQNAPRRARPMAQIYEGANGIYWDTREHYRRWDLRASAGAGRRLVVGPRTMDLTLRWDEGMRNVNASAASKRRTRSLRASLSLF